MFEITLKREGSFKAAHCAIYAAKIDGNEVKKKDIGTEVLVSEEAYNELIEPIFEDYTEELEEKGYMVKLEDFERALDEFRIYVENQDEYDQIHDIAENLLYGEYDDVYVDDMEDNQKGSMIEDYEEKITDFYSELFSYLDDMIETCKKDNYNYIVIE